VSAARAPRLAVVAGGVHVRPAPIAVPPPGAPAVDPGFRSRLPGLGARFLAALAADAEGRGWAPAEVHGLLAAAEERCRLWVFLPRRVGRAPRAAAWRAGGLVELEGGPRALAGIPRATAAASAVCIAAASGARRPPAAMLARLERARIPVGQLADGVAEELRVGWALELLAAPALGPAALAALRERIAAAPRCGWCHTPVLGSSCPRCRGAGE
jgi:hypothetical protein